MAWNVEISTSSGFQGFVDLIKGVNVQLNYLPANLLLFAVFVILFSFGINQGYRKSFGYAGFGTLLSSIFMFFLGLVEVQSIMAVALITAVGLLVMKR